MFASLTYIYLHFESLFLSNETNGLISSHFGAHQQTLVGSSDVSIRALVPAVISAAPYRKALVYKIFFRKILAFTDTLSVSFSNLMTTVVSYFFLNTSAVRKNAENLLLPFVLTSFVFIIYRVLSSSILLGNLLWCQIRISALHILLILLSAL